MDSAHSVDVSSLLHSSLLLFVVLLGLLMVVVVVSTNDAEFIAFNVDCKSFERFKVDEDDDAAVEKKLKIKESLNSILGGDNILIMCSKSIEKIDL
jgi:hypothetical protein